MKCPRDGTELKPVRLSSIVLDKCHTCDGIWCDRGEIKAIRQAKLTGVEAELEGKYGNPEVKVVETDGHMRCPRCEGRLIGMSYVIHSPMRVDRCNECFGYWLDAGELDSALGKPRRSKEDTNEFRIKTVLRSVSRWLT